MMVTPPTGAPCCRSSRYRTTAPDRRAATRRLAINWTLRCAGFDAKFPRDCGEIFLHHLQRNHRHAAPLMVCNQSNRLRLFLR